MSESCSSFEFSHRWVQHKEVEVITILLFQILSNCQTETSKAVQLSQSLGQRVHRIEDWFWGGSGKGKVTVVINIMKGILRGWRMRKWLGAGGGWGHKKWQPDHLSRSASGSGGSNLTLEPNITKALKSCQKWRVLTKQAKPSSTWKAQTEAEAVRAVRRTRRGQVPREAGGVPGNPTHRLPRLRIRRRRVPIGRDWSSHLMQTSSKTMLWVSYINSWSGTKRKFWYFSFQPLHYLLLSSAFQENFQ